jgi:hypothetical protein
MIADDPLACRRALREIREIAAVALLDGAQMSEHDALKTIAAIAQWTTEEVAESPGHCGDLIAGLDALLASEDLERLDDRSAMDLFNKTTCLLQSGAASVGRSKG